MVDLENMGMTGSCIFCREPFKWGVNVISALGVKETRITGSCETCFDSWFEDQDEDDIIEPR